MVKRMNGRVISCQNMPSREGSLLCIDQKELQKSFWKPIKLSRKCGQKGELAKASREMGYRTWTEPCQPYLMRNPTASSSPLVCNIPTNRVHLWSRSGRDTSSDRKAISRRISTLCVSIQFMFTGTFLMSKEADIWRGTNMPRRHLFFCITSKGSTGTG